VLPCAEINFHATKLAVESVIGGKESFILKKSDLVIEFQQKNVDKFDRKRE
jgi:hypothetical protein